MPIKDNVGQAAVVAKWRANQEMRLMKINKRIGELQSQLEKQKLALADEALKAVAGADAVALPAKSASLRDEIDALAVKAHEYRAQHEKLSQEQPPQADEHSTRSRLAHAASVIKWKAQQQIMQQIVGDKARDVDSHILSHKQALGVTLLEEWSTGLEAVPALLAAYEPIQATEAELAEQHQQHEQIKAEPPPATEVAITTEAPAILLVSEAPVAPVAAEAPVAPVVAESPAVLVIAQVPAVQVVAEPLAVPPANDPPTSNPPASGVPTSEVPESGVPTSEAPASDAPKPE